MSDRRPYPPPGRDRFLELDMPERFMFQFYENGSWIEEAVTERARFNRQPDGSYAGDAGGSPIWFRCVCDHGDYFIHMDGGGGLFYYRLLAIGSDGTIALSEGGILHPGRPQ